MANIHGKGAIIYLSPTSGTAAIPLVEMLDWAIDYDSQLVDVTPLNNTWKSFVKGLQGWTGAFSGNMDVAAKTIWTAGIDAGVASIYVYPQGAASTTQFYSGTCWVQPQKLAAGSTTAKASSSFKVTGQGVLNVLP